MRRKAPSCQNFQFFNFYTKVLKFVTVATNFKSSKSVWTKSNKYTSWICPLGYHLVCGLASGRSKEYTTITPIMMTEDNSHLLFTCRH